MKHDLLQMQYIRTCVIGSNDPYSNFLIKLLYLKLKDKKHVIKMKISY